MHLGEALAVFRGSCFQGSVLRHRRIISRVLCYAADSPVPQDYSSVSSEHVRSGTQNLSRAALLPLKSMCVLAPIRFTYEDFLDVCFLFRGILLRLLGLLGPWATVLFWISLSSLWEPSLVLVFGVWLSCFCSKHFGSNRSSYPLSSGHPCPRLNATIKLAATPPNPPCTRLTGP